MQKSYSVYWLKDREQVDVLSQGYIGVTCALARRIREHKKLRGEQFEVEVLGSQLTKQEAFSLELALRPLPNIGGNRKKGGLKWGVIRSPKVLDLYEQITKEQYYCPKSAALVLLRWKNNLPKSAVQLRVLFSLLSGDFATVDYVLNGHVFFEKLRLSALDTNDAINCHDAFYWMLDGAKFCNGKVELDKGAAGWAESIIDDFASKYGWVKMVRIAVVAIATALCARRECRKDEVSPILQEAAYLLLNDGHYKRIVMNGD